MGDNALGRKLISRIFAALPFFDVAALSFVSRMSPFRGIYLGLKALSVASIAKEPVVMVRIVLKRKAGGKVERNKKGICSEDIYAPFFTFRLKRSAVAVSSF